MPSPNSRDVYTYVHRGWKFPTLGYVLRLHEAVLDESSGERGERDIGLIESALNAPVESAGGQDFYPRLFDKVAALGYRLVMNHGFVDGNKRTALVVMESTLEWQGQYLKWGDDASILVMSLLGASHLSQEGLTHALILGCERDPSDPNLP